MVFSVAGWLDSSINRLMDELLEYWMDRWMHCWIECRTDISWID
jgi:hypothetical protein